MSIIKRIISKKFISLALCITAIFMLYGKFSMIINLKAATTVTEDNPISFTLDMEKNISVTNGIKYTINVNDVFDDSIITYKTIFITYPKTLSLITTATPPAGFVFNNDPTNGSLTLVINDEANPGLTPNVVKTTLESYYFVLKTANTFPDDGSVVAISANKNKIGFYEDERGYIHYYQFFSAPVCNWLYAYNQAKQKTMIDPFTGKTMQGYLSTITSQDEQRMIYYTIAKLTGWIGGTRMVKSSGNAKISDENSILETIGSYRTDSTSGSKWYWATGPEAWTSPSTGGNKPYQYNDKGTGTPLVFWSTPLYSGGAGLVTDVYHNFNNPTATSVITNAKAKGGEPNGAPNEYVLTFAFGGADTWNDSRFDPTPPWESKGYYVEYGGYNGDPNTNEIDSSLFSSTTDVPIPVNVIYRSNIMENGQYKTIDNISTSFDTTIYGAENDSFSVLPLQNTPDGYMFKEVKFIDAPQSNFTVDSSNKVTGKISSSKQTIVFLYEEKPPFTISLSGSDDKIYKPSWAPTTAIIRTIGTVSVNNTVKYIMLPTTDTEVILTKDQFEQKYASLPDEYKGIMNETGAGSYLYNMYSATDGSLNGVLENCKLWVMATGTNTTNNSEIVAFDTHTFTNIYTPIDIYHNGKSSDGSILYTKTRVGIGGNLEAKYGVPLDLDGTVIGSPINGYDTVDITHRDLQNLWTFDPSTQDDILALVLDDINYNGANYTFEYFKNSSNWFSATFKFEDDAQNTLYADEVINDFIPYNGTDEISYMLGLDQYAPPVVANFDPVGYKIDGGSLTLMSFPLKYGEIVLPSDNSVVTIVYRQNQIKIDEKYHLFERDSDQVDQDKGELSGITPNTSYVTNGDTFTGKPPRFDGYVYRGYSIDGGLTFIDVAGYPDAPYDAYADLIPSFTATANDTIIYKYKVDTNHTGVADEDLKQITVSAIGIDSHGNIVGTLYSDIFNAFYDNTFTPNPKGTVFIDADGVNWILSTEPSLYPINDFTVKDNTEIKFYYYKDSTGNGTPDYLEANINIKYINEDSKTSLRPDMLITEYTPTDSFSRIAPNIPGYIAVGVCVYKNNSTKPTPTYSSSGVKGEIPLLGENIWNMEFLYQPDSNNNGIADNLEATIIVEIIYTDNNGIQHKESVSYISVDGDMLKISAWSFNKDISKFDYVGGMTTPIDTYAFNVKAVKTVTLNFKEKSEPVPIPKDNKYSGGSSSGYTPSQREASNTNQTESKNETKDEIKNEVKQGLNKNNYSLATFYKPEAIFKDGKLIQLNELVYNGPYINGYPDKSIQPKGNLTRAEAAQIIYNIYGKPEIIILENNLPYKDVSKEAWYAKAVAFLTQYKFIAGYYDGNFYPNKEITRAEFVTLLAKYNNINIENIEEYILKDISNHWARQQINATTKDGIITGYPDETFKPDNMITRAEAVIIINKMLNRPDKWIGNNDYIDLFESEWAYKQLMNASKGYAED